MIEQIYFYTCTRLIVRILQHCYTGCWHLNGNDDHPWQQNDPDDRCDLGSGDARRLTVCFNFVVFVCSSLYQWNNHSCLHSSFITMYPHSYVSNVSYLVIQIEFIIKIVFPVFYYNSLSSVLLFKSMSQMYPATFCKTSLAGNVSDIYMNTYMSGSDDMLKQYGS